MPSVFPKQYQQLIKRLRQARLDAGLTQAEVAAHFGKPQSFIAKIELGERRLDPVEYLKLCELYGKTAGSVLKP